MNKMTARAEERERKSADRLIERARDALSSIALEEIVVALHRRFTYQWEWNAFKERLAASEKELIGTKDRP
jgi:hypothetical protein